MIYTYNKANRIAKIENKSGGITISGYEYSHYLSGSDACKVRNENDIIETTENDAICNNGWAYAHMVYASYGIENSVLGAGFGRVFVSKKLM